MSYYYEVIPLSQINEGLTYKLDQPIPIGSIVQIPLRKKTATGVVLSECKVETSPLILKKSSKFKKHLPTSLIKKI